MNSCQKLVPGCISGRWPPSVRLLVIQQCDPAEDRFRFNTVCIRNLSADVGPIVEPFHVSRKQHGNRPDVVELHPYGRLDIPGLGSRKDVGQGPLGRPL